MEKNFNSLEYWDRFGRGILLGNKPTPQEAGEFISSLLMERTKSANAISELEKQLKIAKQEMSVFAMEVSNTVQALAKKRMT